MDHWRGILLGCLGLLGGGIIKGATGAGAPILAVPLLSTVYGVPAAVALLTFPNLFANSVQGWQFRHQRARPQLTWPFALLGAAGAGVGTVVLVIASSELLMLTVACAVLLYIGFRLARPDWGLPIDRAVQLSGPAGFLGGLLQGAAGLSAPVSITFLNAARLERGTFIATISIFFAGMSLVQIPMLAASGVMTLPLAVASALAFLPLAAGMAIGGWLVRYISPQVFDRLILAILGLIAMRLVTLALL